MKYDKPLVTLLAAAASAIQACQGIKPPNIALDCNVAQRPLLSSGAYEADE